MKRIQFAILAMTIGLGIFGTRTCPAAQADAKVVIVTDHAEASMIPLLKGELNQLGLQVVEVETRVTEMVPRDLTQAALEHHAVAAFRVQVSSNTVEVWIADRATGKVSLREVFTQGSDSSVEARLVVLQAVELLRWSLKEVEAPHRVRDDVAKQPETTSKLTAVPTPDRLWLGIAPLVLASPGGATAGVGAQFDMAIRWSWVGTRFSYGQLVRPAILETDAGRAELTTRWFAVQAVASSPLTPSRLATSLGVGVALISTWMHGISSSPRIATDDSLFTEAPIVEGKLGYFVGKHVQLTLGVAGMVALKSDAIYFEGRNVGSYGRLFGATSLGVQAGIP
jgi:hypothetical protein